MTAMTTQPEYALELALIDQLKAMEYAFVSFDDEEAMKANLKYQLGIHNKGISFTDGEFKKILSHLNTGTVFDRAKLLRDRFALERDNGEVFYITFLNRDDWCLNEFQVTHQVTMQGKRKNRYDVTILINGLPLVQVELKRRGNDLKEAFNQINRYRHDSYDAGYGLFQYVQLFIISNGVNTKYFANNNNRSGNKPSFKQTFYWADKQNNRTSDLHVFSAEFLKPCHIAKMISQYMVLTTENIIKVLRPYQFYAVEAIVDKVKNDVGNAYIWHTTGSGKTLTSFKASQIIKDMPKVDKVMFVVDRRDLDYQTAREFNAFSKGSVDETKNTKKLVEQLNDDNCKLVLTTIQKLNNAIIKEHYLNKIGHLQGKKFVFIFDECHRSQFGDIHQNIKGFFKNAQMFGFTGTPILAANTSVSSGQERTTKDLFDECLHKYVIVDAVKDENVLRFSVEYVGRYNRKGSNNELDISTDPDIKVEDIDTKELLDSPKRLEKIVEYILAHHAHKTKWPDFTAMFCVSSVENLTKYYGLFKEKQNGLANPLKIATIFSYAANEEDQTANGLVNGLIPEENLMPDNGKVNASSRDRLDEYIAEYNAMFNTKFSAKDSESFYNYYKDIGKRVREGKIDILLVVNMFLTGFDSPRLNTLYVDKSLKLHGLIQAFSRTNRILNEKKSHGEIVCFRNLKKATDDAITLFSDKDAQESVDDTVLLEPYSVYVDRFNEATTVLLSIAPTAQSVDALASEVEELAFVKAFREMVRLMNILTTFADFNETHLSLTEQQFNDYKSKYLDIYDKVRRDNSPEKSSILNDVDFNLELLHRDEINVAYILSLLSGLNTASEERYNQQHKNIIDLVTNEIQLRSKRQLIEEFIEENLPKLNKFDNVAQSFQEFWENKKQKAFEQLCDEENINTAKFQQIIDTYQFANRLPRRDEVINALNYRPRILDQEPTKNRLMDKIEAVINTFIDGMGGIV